MKKLKLDLENLEVHTFETEEKDEQPKATVEGYLVGTRIGPRCTNDIILCYNNTEAQNTCLCTPYTYNGHPDCFYPSAYNTDCSGCLTCPY